MPGGGAVRPGHPSGHMQADPWRRTTAALTSPRRAASAAACLASSVRTLVLAINARAVTSATALCMETSCETKRSPMPVSCSPKASCTAETPPICDRISARSVRVMPGLVPELGLAPCDDTVAWAAADTAAWLAAFRSAIARSQRWKVLSIVRKCAAYEAQSS